MFIFHLNQVHLLLDLGQMVASWNFPHNAMSIYSTLGSHHYVIHARKLDGRRQNPESDYILPKMISINCLLLHK